MPAPGSRLPFDLPASCPTCDQQVSLCSADAGTDEVRLGCGHQAITGQDGTLTAPEEQPA